MEAPAVELQMQLFEAVPNHNSASRGGRKRQEMGLIAWRARTSTCVVRELRAAPHIARGTSRLLDQTREVKVETSSAGAEANGEWLVFSVFWTKAFPGVNASASAIIWS